MLRHIRVLWRLESGIAEGRIRLIVRRSVLLVLAGLTALFGLGMLNVAAFLALESRWGPIWGATATALGDFVIAAAFAGIAVTSRPGAELRAAIALRQATMDGIERRILHSARSDCAADYPRSAHHRDHSRPAQEKTGPAIGGEAHRQRNLEFVEPRTVSIVSG